MATEPEAPIVALDAVIRSVSAPERLRQDARAFLCAHGVDDEDMQSMLDAGAERMLVYRRLVHNRACHAIRDFIPRTAARRTNAGLRADVAAFMDACAVKSPYLRDLPREFVVWVEARWKADPNVPDHWHDLARHELLALDVRNDPGGGEPLTGLPVAIDRPLCFDGSARRVSYAYAVHRLAPDPEVRAKKASSDEEEDGPSERADEPHWPVPEAAPTHLLVYRDAKHKVRYLELTAFAAAVLDQLLERGAIVRDALARACDASGEPLSDERLATAAELLADLAERRVMLGATP